MLLKNLIMFLRLINLDYSRIIYLQRSRAIIYCDLSTSDIILIAGSILINS